ncbi:Slam-dependent surface lipoprotein [Pseudomonas auratipiscis]|uniref:Slam-dependent surface lipoprotein n=1 Tax=Pseudomonas auratipiscis TaxID=3115853 RepID=A0AB35WS56_9PSED|nr:MULTISPECIES: Slam-dependent surface lipoprotein [unclassified Pseudomonas]MEE1867551.1 Slam-dependent surface lipoprotein [Pseudomonas sp. 120P]MEE1958378.1 Slam-dependent surface lipoprotein [Pseudomonas sp. 119P]
MKSFNYTVLAVALFGLTGVAQAATSSAQSYDNAIIVDGTQGTGTPNHPSANGAPAVGVKAFYNGAKVAFSGLKGMVATDANGVTSITPAMMPTSHSALGNFDFKQVASQQVYYGEWSQNGVHNDPTRAVYYSGDTAGRVLPTASVTYAVQGINNYSGANLLSGDLTASFGTASPTLTGALSNSALKVSLAANINTADASFSGAAQALNPTTNAQLSKGTTQGSFFGAGATASLAGIAKFTDRNYDTAFGGVRK